jgi:hypothetical protein
MKKEEVLSRLCAYDKRNPDCIYEDDEIQERAESLLKNKETCHCDNCFYGRTKMAEYILQSLENLKLAVQLMSIPDHIQDDYWFEQQDKLKNFLKQAE